jgi:hypothetical protein
MSEPVLGDMTERAGDSDDLACRILVEQTVIGWLEAGSNRLEAFLDNTDEIAGKLVNVSCE